jgi:hypothetical protein
MRRKPYWERESPNTTSEGNNMVRPVTSNLVESIYLDTWPRPAAIVDFGLDSQEHFEALYYPVRNGEIGEEALDKALGDGPALTKLVNGAPSNPHKGIVFSTAYDAL